MKDDYLAKLASIKIGFGVIAIFIFMLTTLILGVIDFIDLHKETTSLKSITSEQLSYKMHVSLEDYSIVGTIDSDKYGEILILSYSSDNEIKYVSFVGKADEKIDGLVSLTADKDLSAVNEYLIKNDINTNGLLPVIIVNNPMWIYLFIISIVCGVIGYIGIIYYKKITDENM